MVGRTRAGGIVFCFEACDFLAVLGVNEREEVVERFERRRGLQPQHVASILGCVQSLLREVDVELDDASHGERQALTLLAQPQLELRRDVLSPDDDVLNHVVAIEERQKSGLNSDATTRHAAGVETAQFLDVVPGRG